MKKKLRIAVLAPVTRPISEDTRGGRPRIIHTLIEALSARGHSITLFGTKDSKTSARVIPIVDKALYSLPKAENPFYQQIIPLSVMLEELKKHQNDFDIINNHLYPEFLPLLIKETIKKPMVTNIHLAVTTETKKILSYFKQEAYISPSRYQKKVLKGFSNIHTIPHGVEIEKYPFNGNPENHFLFFGRMKTYTDAHGKVIDPKGASIAVKLAVAEKEKIFVAGNNETREYFDTYIKPYLQKGVRFVGPHVSIDGPIGFKEKLKLYRNAKALLFPLQEDEAFGMVMIEAMACGTPVIAFDRSTVKEIIKDGVTGFVVKNEKEMKEAMREIKNIDREACRKHVERNFTATGMADAYESLFYNIIK